MRLQLAGIFPTHVRGTLDPKETAMTASCSHGKNDIRCHTVPASRIEDLYQTCKEKDGYVKVVLHSS